MIAPALAKLRIMAPMVRPTQLLHPQREPAPVRPAATVLLLRDTPQGIEVLMTRRSMTAQNELGLHRRAHSSTERAASPSAQARLALRARRRNGSHVTMPIRTTMSMAMSGQQMAARMGIPMQVTLGSRFCGSDR